MYNPHPPLCCELADSYCASFAPCITELCMYHPPPPPPPLCAALCELSDTYCEAELKAHCERLMMHRVSVENVASLLAVASKYKTEVSYILYIILYTQTDCTAEVEHKYYDTACHIRISIATYTCMQWRRQ